MKDYLFDIVFVFGGIVVGLYLGLLLASLL